MNIEEFLKHHGIVQNPFSDEDAQTDPVFKEHCINRARHPSWAKIYGDPSEPATSIVFGEKGSGKTASRMQMAKALAEYNREHPNARLFVIKYDDFNPFLDRFRDRMTPRNRRADRALAHWRLWDHMDAILSLGVTQLVDHLLSRHGDNGNSPIAGHEIDTSRLDHLQKRDLLLLAACYDRSFSEVLKTRWRRLRRRLRFSTWGARWDIALGILWSAAAVGLMVWLIDREQFNEKLWTNLAAAAGAVLVGWLPWLVRVCRWSWRTWGIVRHVRVLDHGFNGLRQVLMSFRGSDITNQPLPRKDRTDDRYELLIKFQGVLKTLGYSGIIVLVDRVDEPHAINGSSELMRALLWPMLDNKFLKHPGIGIKLLLPIELSYFIEREDRDFYQRARLDKQNMVPSLDWTGEALYDIATARLKACAAPGKSPTLRDLVSDTISDQRLVDAFQSLRVPRNLSKFMYRLLVAHTAAHTEDAPAWQISGEQFESTLAVFQRDQLAFDRGMGTT